MTEILHNVPDHGIKKTFVKNFQIHCSMWKHYFWAKLSYISWSRGNVYGCGLTDWKYEPGASTNFFLKYFFYLESTICITFLLSVFLIFDKVIIFPLTSLKSELKLFIRNWYWGASASEWRQMTSQYGHGLVVSMIWFSYTDKLGIKMLGIYFSPQNYHCHQQ